MFLIEILHMGGNVSFKFEQKFSRLLWPQAIGRKGLTSNHSSFLLYITLFYFKNLVVHLLQN